jgi:prophage antirepressor-like protein
MTTVQVTVDAAKASPLVDLFTAQDIRIQGDVHDPLFCAADLAAKIGDKDNYHRALEAVDEEYKRRAPGRDTKGRKQEMLMLTELGLYQYLMRSSRPGARPFQKWVAEHLRDVRRQLVDEAQLAAKIATDALAAAKSQAAHSRGMASQALETSYELRRENDTLRLQTTRHPYTPHPDADWRTYLAYCLTRSEEEGDLDQSGLRAHLATHSTAETELNDLAQSYDAGRRHEAGYTAIKAWLTAQATDP